jgi:Transposase DDE domain
MTWSIPRPAPSARHTFGLAQAHAGCALFCDGGFWGAEYGRTMQLIGVELITPNKHKLGQRPPIETEKARIRLVIESVISNLKRQMRLEHHLAKTLPGLVQRIAQRLLALTLGIFCNILIGRPARALAACDGR